MISLAAARLAPCYCYNCPLPFVGERTMGSLTCTTMMQASSLRGRLRKFRDLGEAPTTLRDGANSWRTERWNSLRLITPNWQSRLPGYGCEGHDPDGYRTMPEVIAFLDRCAKVITAPVEVDTTVTSVQASDGNFLVETNRDAWRCRTVVLAAGACNVARIPEAAKDLGRVLATDTPLSYRHPEQLTAGGASVVAASATGHPTRRREFIAQAVR